MELKIKCHEHGEEITGSITNGVLFVDPMTCSQCVEKMELIGREKLLLEQAEEMGQKRETPWQLKNDMARHGMAWRGAARKGFINEDPRSEAEEGC